MAATNTKPITARCRSCHAAIVWLKTTAGKAMPVDADTARNLRAKLVAFSAVELRAAPDGDTLPTIVGPD